MNIKVKTIQPKESMITMTLDQVSAVVLTKFLVAAVDAMDVSEFMDTAYSEIGDESIDIDDMGDSLAGIVAGLRDEVGV